jgi:hypothetical protein
MMGLLSWLFSKKTQPAPQTRTDSLANTSQSLKQEQNSVHYGRYPFTMAEFEVTKAVLSKNFAAKGHGAPSEDDVIWGVLTRKAMEYAKEKNFGLYANMCLSKGDELRRRKLYKKALVQYLMVCALDLNGAENRSGISTELLKEYPPFNPSTAILAPVTIKHAKDMATRLNMSSDQVKDLYIKSYPKLGMPLPPGKSWVPLAMALNEEINLENQPQCFEQIRQILLPQEE